MGSVECELLEQLSGGVDERDGVGGVGAEGGGEREGQRRASARGDVDGVVVGVGGAGPSVEPVMVVFSGRVSAVAVVVLNSVSVKPGATESFRSYAAPQDARLDVA